MTAASPHRNGNPQQGRFAVPLYAVEADDAVDLDVERVERLARSGLLRTVCGRRRTLPSVEEVAVLTTAERRDVVDPVDIVAMGVAFTHLAEAVPDDIHGCETHGEGRCLDVTAPGEWPSRAPQCSAGAFSCVPSMLDSLEVQVLYPA
jgi:hypothetical protein